MKPIVMVIAGILVCCALIITGCGKAEPVTEPLPAPQADPIVEPPPVESPTEQPSAEESPTEQPSAEESPTEQPSAVEPSEETETTPSPTESVPRITIEELLQKIEQNDDVLIIDTRKDVDSAFQEGHIEGAIPVTFEQIKSGEWTLPEDKDREIVLYCSWPEEQTSARAALELIDQGFTNVKALKGGYNAWKEAGYPLETGM